MILCNIGNRPWPVTRRLRSFTSRGLALAAYVAADYATRQQAKAMQIRTGATRKVVNECWAFNITYTPCVIA